MSANHSRMPFWTNWNRDFISRPDVFARPRTTDELAALVTAARSEGRSVRPVGSGYSYTPLVQSDHVMVALDHFSGVGKVDFTTNTVKVGAGTPLHVLTRELARQGAAMWNLGDIDRQTVAGVTATGSHGTGITIPCMSQQIKAMTLVDGTARVQELTERDADLNVARVSLGALGVATSVTLNVLPMYDLVIERAGTDFTSVLRDLDGNVKNNRNYEFFWFPHHGLTYTKKMNIAPERRGGLSAVEKVTRLANDYLVENALIWLACQCVKRWPNTRKGWLDFGGKVVPNETAITPANRAYATPRLVRHFEIEYAVPYDRVLECLGRLDQILNRHPMKTMFPVEVRFTRADDIPLSMSQGRDVAWIAVHAYRREDHGALFDLVEDLFLQFDGRPHWGKLHSLQAQELRLRYPQMETFLAARKRLDPDDVFMNGHLRRVLGLQPAAATGRYAA